MMMSPRLAPVKRLRLEQAQMSDGDLARALIAGSASAPGLLWDRYAGLARGLLRRALGPDVDVDDRVQETFMCFFGSVKSLRDPDALRSFLIGVIVRVARNELRRRRVRSWLRMSDSADMPDGAVAGLDEEASEALHRLYAILDQLGAEARLAFVLRHVEGLALDEVAVGLGVSLATAKRRLAKARAVVMARVASAPVLCAYGAPLSGGASDGEER